MTMTWLGQIRSGFLICRVGGFQGVRLTLKYWAMTLRDGPVADIRNDRSFFARFAAPHGAPPLVARAALTA
jgi:hypothetical protein